MTVYSYTYADAAGTRLTLHDGYLATDHPDGREMSVRLPRRTEALDMARALLDHTGNATVRLVDLGVPAELRDRVDQLVRRVDDLETTVNTMPPNQIASATDLVDTLTGAGMRREVARQVAGRLQHHYEIRTKPQ